MKKADLEKGRELQNRIENTENQIRKLKLDKPIIRIEITLDGTASVTINEIKSIYTKETNTNLEFLNQLYKDNVLRTLENCKLELEREFELLGTRDLKYEEEED